jgi:SAM-dependent methyltransferase
MDLQRWNQRFLDQPEVSAPTPLVQTFAGRLQPGRARDLACGTGRNALWLAEQGWDVTAVDGAPAALRNLDHPGIAPVLADLQNGGYVIQEETWDLIVVAYYLQRDLFAPAKAGVKPGGAFIAIVHTTEGDEEPTEHRLRTGELMGYFTGWEILHRYEGPPNDASHRRRCDEVVARKPL